MEFSDYASVFAILISVILPLYLNLSSKQQNERKKTHNKLQELSLLVNETPENELYNIRNKVNIMLDYSGANIDFQEEISDCIEKREKAKALDKISKYKDKLKV